MESTSQVREHKTGPWWLFCSAPLQANTWAQWLTCFDFSVTNKALLFQSKKNNFWVTRSSLTCQKTKALALTCEQKKSNEIGRIQKVNIATWALLFTIWGPQFHLYPSASLRPNGMELISVALNVAYSFLLLSGSNSVK